MPLFVLGKHTHFSHDWIVNSFHHRFKMDYRSCFGKGTYLLPKDSGTVEEEIRSQKFEMSGSLQLIDASFVKKSIQFWYTCFP